MLNPKTLLFQTLAGISQLPGYRSFAQSLKQVEATQRHKLSRYLTSAASTDFGKQAGLNPGMAYEDFALALPIQTYLDFEPWIERQKLDPASAILHPNACPRYEPTSGSTSKRKWIPYTRELMNEFDSAASAWLLDMIRWHPGILSGPHYWSLSWLPTDLRGDIATVNDLEVFPLWKKLVMNQVMAVPASVSRLPTLQESLLVTLAHLVAKRDLTLISIWSPTFLLQLLQSLAVHHEELQQLLHEGTLGIRSPSAVQLLEQWNGEVEPIFLSKLWPRLQLISTWDSSTSAIWAAELRRLFPACVVQGKGLWATEGVVTLPFAGRYPLAITSHFYEFRDLADGRILPAWRLRTGQEVQPLLSTGSGFFRYELMDRLRVTDFLHECPCLEFRGRLGGGTDLVGEKMDPRAAAELLHALNVSTGLQCASLLARLSPAKPGAEKPRYLMLAIGDPARTAELAERTETLLLETHHYRVAREMGQLEPAGAVLVATFSEAQTFYEKNCAAKQRIAGGTKIEPLALWTVE